MNLLERRLKRAEKAQLRVATNIPQSLELTTYVDRRLKPMKIVPGQKLNTTQIMILELYEYCNCAATLARESKVAPERIIKFMNGEVEAQGWEYDNLLILRCRLEIRERLNEVNHAN